MQCSVPCRLCLSDRQFTGSCDIICSVPVYSAARTAVHERQAVQGRLWADQRLPQLTTPQRETASRITQQNYAAKQVHSPAVALCLPTRHAN